MSEKKPYGSDERISLPVPSEQAARLADELYLPAVKRSILLLRIGTVDIGHYRLVSLGTEVTPGGYPRLVALYQRMFV